ncbi:hypothetical protein BCR36DRAFT_101861 [Piromyces finnis]|uniref:Uncharacterized protein n=1 Tax=Piromyces finnis TaxID=1754191 RepID=A0A1Y1V480_9FUNG|nr:hypothetical protein BCR36DRAFT_101861 [Piromyces finnis]|eukprot:ORX46695.1 hypothetical protein BCR36DRAFT_101861 [Piromyces finnis]
MMDTKNNVIIYICFKYMIGKKIFSKLLFFFFFFFFFLLLLLLLTFVNFLSNYNYNYNYNHWILKNYIIFFFFKKYNCK